MTHYDVLGVEFNATPHEISRAWRAKARELHPDTGGNTEDFGRAQEAYEVLSNATSRKLYDETLIYAELLEEEQRKQREQAYGQNQQQQQQQFYPGGQQQQYYPGQGPGGEYEHWHGPTGHVNTPHNVGRATVPVYPTWVPTGFTNPLSWPKKWSIPAGVLLLVAIIWLLAWETVLPGRQGFGLRFYQLVAIVVVILGGFVFTGLTPIGGRIGMYLMASITFAPYAAAYIPAIWLFGSAYLTPVVVFLVGVELARHAHRVRQKKDPRLVLRHLPLHQAQKYEHLQQPTK